MASKVKLRKRAIAAATASDVPMAREARHRVFAFKDSKSSSYGPPITAPNKAMFLRDIVAPQLQGQGVIAKHPSDFAIFELGEYDVQTGEVFPHEVKNCMGLVSDFKLSLESVR